MKQDKNAKVKANENKADENDAVLAKLTALQSMDIVELRAVWRELYAKECAKHFTRKYLVPKLSYRIQELAYGGLGSDLEARLALHAKTLDRNKSNLLPPAGTVLVRVYKSVEHQVAVLKNGRLQYNGLEYRSLSGIAKDITGMSWNGHVFFGLKQRGKN